MSGRSLEFFLASGCKILKCMLDHNDDIYRIYIPFPCPHLVIGEGCSCYEQRPLACIEFEPEEDPIVRDICKLKQNSS